MKVNEKNNFFNTVYRVVKQIPKGKVMAYSQVAALCGNVRAARAVGWALRALPQKNDIPWHRVVNQHGFLTIKNQKFGPDEQKKRLEKEGVVIRRQDSMYHVDMSKYLANIS